MGHPSAEAIDLVSNLEIALENALASASSGLKRASIEVGAEGVAVLLTSGSQVEVTYFWSALGHRPPSRRLSSAEQDSLDLVKTGSGLVEKRSPQAQLLRELISPNSQSFLLFPWQVQRTAVTIVFCFANAAHGYRPVPDAVRERLNLIGLATWSVKEIARLRSELRTVTSRLAGRKLVERAKVVLNVDQGMSEERAYEYLRRLSRQRRISLVALAEEVVRDRGGRDPSQLCASESGVS
jgi:hypothetical protein